MESRLLPHDEPNAMQPSMIDSWMSPATPGECSSGFQSNWNSAAPSSAASTFGDEFSPTQQCIPPPPQPPPVQPRQIPQPLLPGYTPEKIVEEFECIMSNENDQAVLGNSVCLLFGITIDSDRGSRVCKVMPASPVIMRGLHYVLTDNQFANDEIVLWCATGVLTNISKYEEGRTALLSLNEISMHQPPQFGRLSPWVDILIRSLQSGDGAVILALTAIHNLLLDGRLEIQEIAKEQIKHGIQYIVQLLKNQSHDYKFKVIVLDCMQILAYGNRENKLAIKESGGSKLILETIEENFNNQTTGELVETASRVLKLLSSCPANKVDIIENGGVNILTHCINRNNQDILKTCLWTLRNLSDLINDSASTAIYRDNGFAVNRQLAKRLLHILHEYAENPLIVTCALGIIENLTCNNEAIKQFICESNGVDLILNTIAVALRDGRDSRVVDNEVMEPAVRALCHLMNQSQNPHLAKDTKMSIMSYFDMFTALKSPTRQVSEELSKAVEKLASLTFKNT